MLKNKRIYISQTVLYAVLAILLLLAFVPIILMVTVSLKSTYQLNTDFWGLPRPVFWSNYSVALSGIYVNMLNSFLYVVVAVLLLILLAAMGGYVFAVLDFPGKTVLFMVLLSMMMIPAVLTLTPRYVMISDMGLKNNPLALILPWITGGQVMAIVLTGRLSSSRRARCSNQPASTGRVSSASSSRLRRRFPSPFSRRSQS